MMKSRHQGGLLVLAACLSAPLAAQAEVDKVYSPRIDAGSLELEARSIYLDDDDNPADNSREDKFSIGYAFSDRVALEAYLNAEKVPGESYELEEYELEGRFNLYQNNDSALGLLTEVEKSREDDIWNLKVGPLYEQSFSPLVRMRANAFVGESHGSDVQDSDTEYSGAFQLAYTEDDDLQPAVEYYGARNNHGAGPVLLGEFEIGEQELEWEAGVIFGLTDNSDDVTYRWQLEMEF
ncbi:hypothetical protein A11A3_10361 [Alcanivorax hongdengensis A-11-3]|uniref:Outer membrane protein beta-barrel domain-containing protein n=1 Tax=Alcanivorax hongdengensis A-11-3 TaxID=1177179 RepID=L0WAM7_9GAMM|nr:hypothetical protein [Alcanivorax hongdengensis]EKF74054.1 hypothetical protein A11A3_10361 [Alcanivorax hongdengensis A-11-3]